MNYSKMSFYFLLCFYLLTLTVTSYSYNPHPSVASLSTQGDKALEIQGSYAFVGLNTQFNIFDTHNKENPILIGTLATPERILDIAIKGKTAYVTLNPGLWVVDISNPSQPQKVSEYNEYPVWYIVLSETQNYAYVTGTNYMHILDISDPNNLTTVSTFESLPHTLSGLIDLDVQNNLVYVMGSGPDRTWIIDVSNPLEPIEVAILNLGGWEMDVEGDTLFLTATGCNATYCFMYFESYDISNVYAPVLQDCFCGIIDIMYVRALLVSDGWAYIANSQDLRIIGVADPSNFAPLPPLPVAGARAIAVSGNYIYLITDNNTLQILESPLTRTYLPTIYR